MGKNHHDAEGSQGGKSYVVFEGREPGAYKTWEQCSAQVTGYSGAGYNSTSTIGDKYYVVEEGRSPGVYPTWQECHRQVNKYSGASFCSYPNPSKM